MLITDKKKKSNGDRRDKRRYSDFLVGLGLGAVGVVILSLIFKPRCPKCGKKILLEFKNAPFVAPIAVVQLLLNNNLTDIYNFLTTPNKNR